MSDDAGRPQPRGQRHRISEPPGRRHWISAGMRRSGWGSPRNRPPGGPLGYGAVWGSRFAARRTRLGGADPWPRPPRWGGHRHRQHLGARPRAVATSFHRIDHAIQAGFCSASASATRRPTRRIENRWTRSAGTSTSSTPTGCPKAAGDRRSRTAGAEAVGPPQRHPSRARHPRAPRGPAT